jgi:hypothetical protein
MAFLGEPLKDQPGARVLETPRCTIDWIEEERFEPRRDLCSEMDLVFFDTTSIYCEGEGGQEIGRHGKSKDHRPDLKQMVVGLTLDLHGWPLCCELWPGKYGRCHYAPAGGQSIATTVSGAPGLYGGGPGHDQCGYD